MEDARYSFFFFFGKYASRTEGTPELCMDNEWGCGNDQRGLIIILFQDID